MAGVAMLVTVLFAATTAAQSIPVTANSISTTISSGTITRAPTPLPSSIAVDASCSACVIALDSPGLKQIFWYNSTWSVTLDTEYVTITTFNGSNATGATSTRTVLGNLSTVVTTNAPFFSNLEFFQAEDNDYFDASPTLVRGTNGSVGTTSFPYGQAFAQVTAIDYRSLTPYSSASCPLNMGEWEGIACSCVMNTWFPPDGFQRYYNSTLYNLDATYYQPLPSSAINMGLATDQNIAHPLTPWDGEAFSIWLDGNEALNSQLPNWRECAYWNTANGPAGVQLPVNALTATIVATVPGHAEPSPPTPRPSIPPSVAMAQSTVQPSPSPSSSDSEGSGGSEGSGSGSNSDSSGSSNFGSASAVDSSGYGSGGGSPGSDNSPPTVLFAETTEGHTTVGTMQGNTAAVISGTTNTAGSAPSSAGGALISTPYGASSIAVNVELQPLPTAGPQPSAAVLSTAIATVGSQTITASPGASELYYAGTALSQNAPDTTIGDSDVYVGPSGLLVSGGSNGVIASAPSPGLNKESGPGAVTFTAAGQTFTSSTYAIPPSALPSSTTVIDSQAFTTNPTAIAISGTLLTEGGSAITIQGTPISLGASGLVIAGSTVSFQNGPLKNTSQTSEGLGAVILAGFGPSPATTSATGSNGTGSPAAFKGSAAGGKSISLLERRLMFVALILGVVVGVLS